MTKIFDLPYCTNDLRHYLKPLSTTNELFRLKQYFYYQKDLAIRLINYQRLLTSKYNRRQSIRYNHKKLFKNFRLSSIRSNSNEKRFNRISNSSTISKSRLESQTSLISINRTKNSNTTIIKLNTCSTLIATGHGISKSMSSVIYNDNEQSNHGILDEDISLSKICKKIFNRSR